MEFSDKNRYNRTFQKVLQKGGYTEIKYIKRFQGYKALEISVGNNYSEEQLIHTFLDYLQQGGK